MGDTGTGVREGWWWWGGSVIEKGTAVSGVDGDDLAAASADQEDPVETISEDLKELHVWERRVKETRGNLISIKNILCKGERGENFLVSLRLKAFGSALNQKANVVLPRFKVNNIAYSWQTVNKTANIATRPYPCTQIKVVIFTNI